MINLICLLATFPVWRLRWIYNWLDCGGELPVHQILHLKIVYSDLKYKIRLASLLIILKILNDPHMESVLLW